MVSHLFSYQLALLALVWLFVMLHGAASRREAPSPPPPPLSGVGFFKEACITIKHFGKRAILLVG